MKFVALAAILISFEVLSQDITYDWEKDPTPFKDTVIQNEDAVVLSQFYDVKVSGTENINTSCHIVTHIKTLVLTEAGIEKTNKFYYYIDRTKNLQTIKARVIAPSGKIIDVPNDHIINSVDEKDRTKFKYFAYEGVEKGAILEVLLIEKYDINKNFLLIEDFFTANSEFNILDFEARFTRNQNFQFNYELTINKHLYKVNNIQEAEMYQTSITAKNLPKYKEEPYSIRTDYEAYLYYQFGLSAHLKMARLDNFKGQRFQFNGITNQVINERRLFSIMNNHLDTYGKSNMEILYDIENFIKEEGKTVESNHVKVESLGQGTFTEEQQLKLIYQYAKLLQLDPTIILTTETERLKISTEFVAPFLYTDLFLLFPQTQEVYSPSKYSRIHAIPQEYLGNYYLNTLSNVNDEFKPSTADFSIDSVMVKMKPDFASLTDSISIYRQTSGHFCRNFLSEDEASSPELRIKALNYFTHYHLPECSIYDSIIENDYFVNYMRKPLVGKFRATSSSDIIEIDSTFILSVGRYIGNQISLHNENPFQRISPIRVGNPHIYKRQIEIEIPENYEVKNLDELVLKTSAASADLGLGFESSYAIKGNLLTISITEWYNRAVYQAQFYRCFLEVMNAAADFNNIQLVFDKK